MERLKRAAAALDRVEKDLEEARRIAKAALSDSALLRIASLELQLSSEWCRMHAEETDRDRSDGERETEEASNERSEAG